MTNREIYQDIAKRTGGDIYIGVVGPVRTGKSTFIHRFLEAAVIPAIQDGNDRARTVDELPQSGSGRTVMTTEPKFVPDEAVAVTLGETALHVKMVDCVGYMVEGALGTEEDGEERMVMTPWSAEPIPFRRAAEIGTDRVIREHATVAVLVTTDGSIAELPREAYLPAEERVVAELRAAGKPFAILLNSRDPSSPQAHALATELEEKYRAPVALLSCQALNAEDAAAVLRLILDDFPIRQLDFTYPTWVSTLPTGHPVRQQLRDRIRRFSQQVSSFHDVAQGVAQEPHLTVRALDAGEGTGELCVSMGEDVFFQTASELSGLTLNDEGDLLRELIRLSAIDGEYGRVAQALADVRERGYGIVMPTPEQMQLEEPELIRQGGSYAVRVAAHAESIHMIRTGIRTEVCPVVGTASQSEEVIRYLTAEMQQDPERVWSSNMFGRSLYDMVNDGMNEKLNHMPQESREKLGETLSKIINEGSNGLICILL